MALRPVLALTCLMLSACVGTQPTLHLMDPPSAARHLPDRLGRVEVRDVSLPQYAKAPEITLQAADGSLKSYPNQLWADAPAAAITRILAEQISDQSGATAIAEPWPMSQGPDRRLDVRITRLYAGADGRMHVAGRYFVTPAGAGGRDLTRRFDIAVPLASESADGVSRAQAKALTELAAQIAQLK